MDYLKCHRNFKKKLEKELNKMIAREKKSLEVKNIPSDKFCDALCQLASTTGGRLHYWKSACHSGSGDKRSACAVVLGMERLA